MDNAIIQIENATYTYPGASRPASNSAPPWSPVTSRDEIAELLARDFSLVVALDNDQLIGFGIWNGSSFASPACAGDMAHMMCAPSFVKDDRSRVEKMTEIVERAIKEEG